MEIKKDSRQMPSKATYTANKMYSDIVYGWLQVNSYWDQEGNIRWIPEKMVKFTAIGEALGITRQTASTKFKKLLDEDDKGKEGLGLVHYNSELKRYELVELADDLAMLIQNGTLSKMISALNENSISLFAYLFKRYWANGCKPFEFTKEQLKKAIGISHNTKSNDYIIDGILEILKKLELLDYEVEGRVERGEYKDHLKMLVVNNEIPDTIKQQKIGREIEC